MAARAIDYWCNAFVPERRALWEASIAAQGIPIRIRSGEDDFVSPGDMVARMDRLGIECLILPVADDVEKGDLLAFERYCTAAEAFEQLAADWPGRFASLGVIDPTLGMPGVRRSSAMLEHRACVGLLLHPHSWDVPLDDRSLYPYYALAAERGATIVVQTGASGGLMPSECGRPIAIDRPALYFRDLPIVLSHTGWPWVEEAIAMSLKHPSVFLGTASHPPHRWPAALVDFLRGPGRGKTLFGTSFPTVGHVDALARLDSLSLDGPTRDALLEGAARTAFPLLAPAAHEVPGETS